MYEAPNRFTFIYSFESHDINVTVSILLKLSTSRMEIYFRRRNTHDQIPTGFVILVTIFGRADMLVTFLNVGINICHQYVSSPKYATKIYVR